MVELARRLCLDSPGSALLSFPGSSSSSGTTRGTPRSREEPVCSLGCTSMAAPLQGPGCNGADLDRWAVLGASHQLDVPSVRWRLARADHSLTMEGLGSLDMNHTL